MVWWDLQGYQDHRGSLGEGDLMDIMERGACQVTVVSRGHLVPRGREDREGCRGTSASLEEMVMTESRADREKWVQQGLQEYLVPRARVEYLDNQGLMVLPVLTV